MSVRVAARRYLNATNIGALLLSACLLPTPSWSASVDTLYSFVNKRKDLRYPNPGLAQLHGVLFGTAMGYKTAGGVFKVFPGRGRAKTMNFPASPNLPGVLAQLNGTLYGTTAVGDAAGATIYEVDPLTLAITTIYTFGTKESYPYQGLIVVGDKLYGTTYEGGTNGAGAVFQFDPLSHTMTVIHSQTEAEGSQLFYSLETDGTSLYGTARSGGADNNGTIFKVDPSTGQETTLYSFPANGDVTGSADSALTYHNGELFGAGYFSGGYTLYRFNLSSGRASLLHNFKGGGDVEAGFGFKEGLLYGTSPYDVATPNGTLFTIDLKTKALTTIYTFSGGADGRDPQGLIQYGPAFYGTTGFGGAAGTGTVFKLEP